MVFIWWCALEPSPTWCYYYYVLQYLCLTVSSRAQSIGSMAEVVVLVLVLTSIHDPTFYWVLTD
jgi:hypothetical protein